MPDLLPLKKMFSSIGFNYITPTRVSAVPKPLSTSTPDGGMFPHEYRAKL